METPTAARDALARYARLIRAPLGTPAAPAISEETDSELRVDRGVVFPMVLLSPNSAGSPEVHSCVARLIEVTAGPGLERLVVVDSAGHHRPVYRPLLIYFWLRAFALAYETLPRSLFGRWDESLRHWADLLESDLGESSWPAGGFPASRGSALAESAWTALALHVAGRVFIRDAWTDLASDFFGRLGLGQRESGAFLESTAGDSTETVGYDELCLLHAAADYAVQAEDRAVAAAVARATRFHLATTQLDHSTSQPWALFAFIWNTQARPLADEMLLAGTINRPDGPNGISLMLLADALYSLRLFGITGS